jgi:1-acyl-sn-glycerol-3-phosphate acyltransferase
MPFAAIRWLRSVFVSIPLIVLGTLAATTLGMVASLLLPKTECVDEIKRAWARWILACSFVSLTVRGRDNIPSGRPVLFCCNHLSYLDPPALVAALGRPVRFLAKDSLFRLPFLGWAMRLEGDIPVARDNPRAAARSLARAAEAIRAGRSFIVFPEGRRSRDGQLQPFLSGAFRLALHAHAPVVPVAIRGSREALRPGTLFFPGGTVRIAIGASLATDGVAASDQESISARVEQAIRQLL